MQATIMNYRSSRHNQKCNHIIVEAKGIDSREKASKFVGKEAVWKTSSGKEINGKIASPHGNKGALRIIFERGLPGQAIGGKVEIKE